MIAQRCAELSSIAQNCAELRRIAQNCARVAARGVRRRHGGERLLLDELDLEELAGRVVDQVGEEHLDHDVRLRLLRLDVRREVGLARVDRRLHLLHRRAALGDVALCLPRELDVVGDVEVDGELSLIHI